jgi:hypothetical protein
MRLSAFLMLLEGRMFIPTLSTLQRSDPLESHLPLYSFQYCERWTSTLSSAAIDWLKKEMPDSKKVLVEGRAIKGPRYLTETWIEPKKRLRVLQKRFSKSEKPVKDS